MKRTFIFFTTLIIVSISACSLKACNLSSTSSLVSITPSIDIPLNSNSLETISPAPTLDSKKWIEYTIPSDLIEQEILYLEESSEGILWLAGSRGLISFDGEVWSIHLDANTLGEIKITDLAVAPDGDVWLGTQFNGILRYDGKNLLTYSTSDGLISAEIEALAVTKDGFILAASRVGLSFYENGQWTSQEFPGEFYNTFVHTIFVTSDDVIWIGIQNGLVSYDRHEWKYQWQGNPISCITVAPDGSLWFSTVGPELVHIFNGEAISYHNDELERFPPVDIVVTSDNIVWIASWGGYKVAQFDGNNWTTWDGKALANQGTETDSYSPPYKIIFSMIRSHDESLWFGTQYGVYRFIP